MAAWRPPASAPRRSSATRSRRTRRLAVGQQGPRARRAAGPAPDLLPARPRPHRALQGVPAAEAQDAGVPRARGRPLPRPPHPHARGRADRPDRRPGAPPERGPHRGDRARPRPRPHAVRAPRRAGAHARSSAGRSATTSRACGSSTTSRTTAQGLNLTWEVRDGIVNHTVVDARARDARGAGRAVRRPHRLRQPRRRRRRPRGRARRRTSCRARRSRSSARTHGERINTLVTDLVAQQRRRPEIRLSDDGLPRARRAARLPVRARLPARRGPLGAGQGHRARPDAVRATTSTTPRRCRQEYHRAPGDLPTRIADYIAGMTDRYALRTYEQLFLPQGWLL